MIKTRTYFQCFVWFTTTMNLYVWILSFQLCLCVPSDNKDRLSAFWVCLVLFVCLFHSDLFYFHYNDYSTGLFFQWFCLFVLLPLQLLSHRTIWVAAAFLAPLCLARAPGFQNGEQVDNMGWRALNILLGIFLSFCTFGSINISWSCWLVWIDIMIRLEDFDNDMVPYNCWQHRDRIETLPKAQQTRGLSSSFESNLLGHITSSNANLDKTSSSKSRPSIYFKISTKHHYLD